MGGRAEAASCQAKGVWGSGQGVLGGEQAGWLGTGGHCLGAVHDQLLFYPPQHLAVQASLLCIFHLFLLPTLPEEPPHVQATSELLARSFFACGISTVLQTTLGSR